MTFDQITLLIIFVIGFSMFAWGRWRYDVIAIAMLMSAVIFGIVPPDQAFDGFGHAAVITVACVLILSHALDRSGVVTYLARLVISSPHGGAYGDLVVLCLLVGVFSSFMNNIGALALMLPVALSVAHRNKVSPSLFLMPMAFASLMGGLMTLIGTPPNIIISKFREEEIGEAFGFFDFTPVGLTVVVLGLIFIFAGGFRLTPIRRKAASDTLDELEKEKVHLIPVLIFGLAVLVISLRLYPPEIAFTGAVLLILIFGYLKTEEIYKQIDWPVITLLAAMLPVGKALDNTGTADLIAMGLLELSGDAPDWLLIWGTILSAMALSNIVNNAAAALLMAPIAFSLANTIGSPVDPFLLAVAIGSSCAFITPIGHQSNLLVMGPGQYEFKDYCRLGIPLSLVVSIVATLAIEFIGLL